MAKGYVKEADIRKYDLNSNTFIEIGDENPSRNVFIVSNPSPVKIVVCLRPIDLSDKECGVTLQPEETRDFMSEIKYTGKISAIAKYDSPTISVTEY